MGPTAKRTLLAMLVMVFLLAACAPAPAPTATQDPSLVQQATGQSTVLTAAAETAQEQDRQLLELSEALTAAAQTPQALEPQSPTPSTTPPPTAEFPTQTIDPEEAQFLTIVAAGQTKQAEYTPTGTATPTETLIPSVTPGSLADLNAFLSSEDGTFDNCTYQKVSAESVTQELTVKRNDLLNIGIGSKIIIIRPVNLRNGPTLSHRILMILRTDPTHIPSRTPNPGVTPGPSPTPDPTATPNPNRIIYEIIGGPGYSNFGTTIASANPALDGTDEVSPYRVEGRKYKWWKIQSLHNTKITGWVVEASACGLYNFIEPVTN